MGVLKKKTQQVPNISVVCSLAQATIHVLIVYITGTTCVRTRFGLDYRGTINTTISGKPCIAWADAFNKLGDCHESDFKLDELCYSVKMAYADDSNYCRPIPTSSTNFTLTISCFTEDLRLEECSGQKYCGECLL